MILFSKNKSNLTTANRTFTEARGDGGSESTLELNKLSLKSKSFYRRTKPCIEESRLKTVEKLFREGLCDVAKQQGQIYVEFPASAGESLKGFEAKTANGQTRLISTQTNPVKFVGGDSNTFYDMINRDAFDDSVIVVGTACYDSKGYAEGATIYLLQILEVASVNQVDDNKPDEEPKQAQQTQSTQDDALAAQAQASKGSDNATANTGNTGEDGKKESFVRRDKNGNMIPFKILRAYEADGDNQSANSNTSETESDSKSLLEMFEEAAPLFLKGQFTQGMTALSGSNYQAKLVASMSTVRTDKLPWLGRCTFSVGTNQTTDGIPCINMVIIPWNHESQSSKDDAWSALRPLANAAELDDSLAKSIGKSMNDNAGGSGTQQATQQTTQGTTGNALLDAATANGQDVVAKAQPPANQIQAQQQMGHSPETEDPSQVRTQLQQMQTSDKASYAKVLVNQIKSIFGNSAGTDNMTSYRVFEKWRDVIFSTDADVCKKNGLQQMKSQSDIVAKYTSFRTSTNASAFVLY